jgi:hypothetical protein
MRLRAAGLYAAIGAALAAGAPAGAFAQSDSSASRRTWHLVPGVHIGSPALVSALLAVGRCIGCTNFVVRHVFVSVEPGMNAGRMSLGYASAKSVQMPVGFTARATFLRRWRDVGVNYAGVEVSGHLIFIGPRVGLFREIGGKGGRLSLDYSLGY